jgi:molybdopterin-containing oxidoreductase family iron-sulfur binding subunit
MEVRVREGRVHKVEGNPEHPVNGGGLCARGQSAVQGLYSPDRLRTPLVRDKDGRFQPASWEQAEKVALEGLGRAHSVRVITGAVRGALEDLIREWPGAQHVAYEPLAYEALREANRQCFGIPALPVLRFAEARLIVLFGADVLETYVSPVGYARGIQEARRSGARIVYVGPRLSLTGARADQWIPGETPPAGLLKQMRAVPSLAVACDDLATAIAVNRLNAEAGALNRTVRFDRGSSLDTVTSKLDIAEAEAVVVLDANPVYARPDVLKKAAFVVCLSSYPTETTSAAHVVLPVHTPLESWGDYEPWTGIHCLQQPAMAPVFETRDAGDLLIRLAGLKHASYYEFLRARWRKRHPQPDFEAFWAKSLQQGGWWRDVPERKVVLSAEMPASPAAPRQQGYRLHPYASVALFDGRGANRPWLQELPDPITQAVWDTWVEINPADAELLSIRTGHRVEVSTDRAVIQVPAYVYPGITPGHVAIPLGQGHRGFGRYADGVGANACVLGPGPVHIKPLSRKRELVTVGGSDLQHHREIARSRTLPAAPERPSPAHELSLYPEHPHPQHRWGMVLDLDACTGCGACIVACYAENNVPVVGKERVSDGRIMSWIRLERFFGQGSTTSDPFQIDWTLVMCQQCENAPCEPVCPVFAAYHNEEGLNGQVYNRCVGTRYCANNCPYRVRRFNWFEYERPAPEEWQLNPDVTVRTKGVMEKCTFCIQRIVAAKDRARREGRSLADGDVVPACAQSCPTQAIVFGDLNDKNSRVSHLAQNERRYRILEELNTRPAVTYLMRERRRV